MIRQIGISLLTFVNIVTFIGIAYYFFPGYPHIFVSGDPISSQPTAGCLCIILFFFCFFTMAQFTPKREAGTCWACGKAGMGMQWWTPQEQRGATNQRVSYLVHPCCVALAEKQAGL